MNKEIHDYYEKTASIYDKDRFENSYGKYIHSQELHFLLSLELDVNKQKNLDLACGTGRFLNFATHGIDFSQNMIDQAKMKYPEKFLALGEADNTDLPENQFDNILSFHLLMHLTEEKVQSILKEAQRVLKNGGRFIFDIPSKKRRKLLNHRQNNWHGANDFTIQEIKKLVSDQWEIKSIRGILFFPVHRLPVFLRRPIRFLDSLICQSPLKEYSSYIIIVAEKK